MRKGNDVPPTLHYNTTINRGVRMAGHHQMTQSDIWWCRRHFTNNQLVASK